MELEESARGELQRTATELESVLNIRLSDIEADLQARSSDLEERLQALSGMGKASASIRSRSGVTLEDPLRKMAAELSSYRLVEGHLGEGESNLDGIEEEIMSLGDRARMAQANGQEPREYAIADDDDDLTPSSKSDSREATESPPARES